MGMRMAASAWAKVVWLGGAGEVAFGLKGSLAVGSRHSGKAPWAWLQMRGRGKRRKKHVYRASLILKLP